MHLDHDHSHEIPHTHTHEHGPHGEHIHAGEHIDCAGCGQEVDPKEETMALMRFMVGHNAQHANELAALADKIGGLGEHEACEQIKLAVADLEKGNKRLSEDLASLEDK